MDTTSNPTGAIHDPALEAALAQSVQESRQDIQHQVQSLIFGHF